MERQQHENAELQREHAAQLAQPEALLLAGGNAPMPRTPAPGTPSAAAALKTIPWADLREVQPPVVKGDGSFGVVRMYRWGVPGDMRVAVKELRAASLGLSAADAEALTAEAGLQARLEHNNVVRVWGVASDAAGMRRGLVMKVRGGL